jgi:serine/threonine-protein kinase ATR
MDISSLWLSSAQLARKANAMHQSFNAVLHASQLGDSTATIENARLLWKDGHRRKAIHLLQSAIDSNAFAAGPVNGTSMTSTRNTDSPPKMLLARAQLMLAKWLDGAGQTNSMALLVKYQQPPKTFPNWEKGHYYIGRYYKMMLESEKAFDPDNEQSDHCVTFQYHRLIVENYIRSLTYGTKYIYQTLPRALTLWLEMGAQVDKPPEGKLSVGQELYKRRLEQLSKVHDFLDKRIPRLPAYIFYTSLPQVVARITHPNPKVFERLTHIVIKVVQFYPKQALWSLFSIMTTRTESERRNRGKQILQTLRNLSQRVADSQWTLKTLISKGEHLAEQLLTACNNGKFPANKSVKASLTKDLKFSHRCTPCPLVVPIEGCLTATLPTLTDKTKKDHNAFSRDVISIDSFEDEVLVVGSLAKPRRLTARGSDGVAYKLLIKPKDDLRTDQRLMEFNSLINRALKKDAESSRRQLYIRTYAVTPLNEECGIIEWVDGLKTLRDILLPLYQARGIHPDYNRLRDMLDKPLTDAKKSVFTKDVLGQFPPVMPVWFVMQFPNPSAWFAARLRYTRSCAVTSMVGTILGLGDRHTENILLEEGNGGVFHVDFNCLFDKGRTFERPEKVPFRLTHNMVAAMGIYGFEGPFRQCCELTLARLRQHEETLMTILEAFIYDPTLDLQNRKKARNEAGVRLQPHAVVDAIKKKVKGYVQDFDTGANQYIPLGVEGQVEELIKAAVDPKNLAAMYIGWCPFF